MAGDAEKLQATYEIHKWENQRLPFIYHEDRVRSGGIPQTRGNWHDSLELLLVTEGAGQILVDGRCRSMEVGDLFVINSGVPHAILGTPAVRYHCLIIGIGFCEENGVDATHLAYRTKIGDGGMRELYIRATEELNAPADRPFRVCGIRTAVLQLLLRLNRDFCAEGAHGRGVPSEQVRAALDYINAHYAEPLTLDGICAAAGESKYHFLRRFKAATGYTVVTYINLLRCKMAARMLSGSDARIGEIAALCGFDGQSYFSRTFERYIGSKPSEYRRRRRAEAENTAG